MLSLASQKEISAKRGIVVQFSFLLFLHTHLVDIMRLRWTLQPFSAYQTCGTNISYLNNLLKVFHTIDYSSA